MLRPSLQALSIIRKSRCAQPACDTLRWAAPHASVSNTDRFQPSPQTTQVIRIVLELETEVDRLGAAQIAALTKSTEVIGHNSAIIEQIQRVERGRAVAFREAREETQQATSVILGH